MNLFEQIKANVTVRQAAYQYGVETDRRGMALCPFYNDRHPSLYVADDHYYCFACGEHGDVMDFVAKFYDLFVYDAAQKLAADFGLDPGKQPSPSVLAAKRKKTEVQSLREKEQLCFSVLTAYLLLLEEWKIEYAPEAPNDTMDDRFVEACHKLDYVEYLLDTFIHGDSYERADVVNGLEADDKIGRLKRRLERLAKEDIPHEQVV